MEEKLLRRRRRRGKHGDLWSKAVLVSSIDGETSKAAEVMYDCKKTVHILPLIFHSMCCVQAIEEEPLRRRRRRGGKHGALWSKEVQLSSIDGEVSKGEKSTPVIARQ
jgi:hypothetical protein